jgi:hypothetical protein
MDKPTKMLTGKQQGFTDSVLDGCSLADAYRNNYNCANMSGNAIRVEASRLANNPCVALMVTEKRQAIQAARLWTRQMALYEAETNLEMARDAKQMGPANQALKLAAELSGLTQSQTPGDLRITSVIVNKTYKTTDNDSRALPND